MAATWEERIDRAATRSARVVERELKVIIERAVNDHLVAQGHNPPTPGQAKAIAVASVTPPGTPAQETIDLVKAGLLTKLEGLIPDDPPE